MRSGKVTLPSRSGKRQGMRRYTRNRKNSLAIMVAETDSRFDLVPETLPSGRCVKQPWNVYGLQILDATLEAGNTEAEGPAGAHAHHISWCAPTARAPWPRPASRWRLPAGGLRHLRLEHCAHLHPDAGYVSAADNDYAGVTGKLRHVALLLA